MKEANEPGGRGTNEMQVAIEIILQHYAQARAEEPFGTVNPLWARFERVASVLKRAEVVRRFPMVSIRWSAGQGRWATVPWIAALDSRETKKTSEGVYVIYLFCADMSGVYLTLNQAAQSAVEGRADGLGGLRERTNLLRSRCAPLKSAGFQVQAGIDLRSDLPLILGYQESTVAYKFYERAHVPPDKALLVDLEAALSTYDRLIPSRRIFATREQRGEF